MPHPPKKSEIESNWYVKKRNKRKLEAPERHLILCEGRETEYNYFVEVKKRINDKYRNKIVLNVDENGKGRLELLKSAKKLVEKSELEINHVWLVYDKDDFSNDDFDNTVYKIEEINKKSATKYHALWSNQCIEVWFLLHFIDLKVDVLRKEYIKKLNDNFEKLKIEGKYSKNDKEIFNKLEKYREDAQKRAKRIIEENIGKSPSQIAPASMIYQIFDVLGAYLN